MSSVRELASIVAPPKVGAGDLPTTATAGGVGFGTGFVVGAVIGAGAVLLYGMWSASEDAAKTRWRTQNERYRAAGYSGW